MPSGLFSTNIYSIILYTYPPTEKFHFTCQLMDTPTSGSLFNLTELMYICAHYSHSDRATQDLECIAPWGAVSCLFLNKVRFLYHVLITHSCTLLSPPDCIFNKLYTSTTFCHAWHGFFPPVVVRVFPLGVNCPKFSEVYWCTQLFDL